MKNILARGGVEFLAVFLGIALSLWVDEYQKSKEAKKLNKQILTRLYDNLEADSTDAIWNSKAHKKAQAGSEKVLQWCENGQPKLDSIDIFISAMAIRTIFVNNFEEYNALKSSGRMELIDNENLIKSLHDYYTMVNFIKEGDKSILYQVNNHFVPFMSDYADFYGIDENKIVYDVYRVFHLTENPPLNKLKFFASAKQASGKVMSKRYKEIAEHVVLIRKMIRKELSS